MKTSTQWNGRKLYHSTPNKEQSRFCIAARYRKTPGLRRKLVDNIAARKSGGRRRLSAHAALKSQTMNIIVYPLASPKDTSIGVSRSNEKKTQPKGIFMSRPHSNETRPKSHGPG